MAAAKSSTATAGRRSLPASSSGTKGNEDVLHITAEEAAITNHQARSHDRLAPVQEEGLQ